MKSQITEQVTHEEAIVVNSKIHLINLFIQKNTAQNGNIKKIRLPNKSYQTGTSPAHPLASF